MGYFLAFDFGGTKLTAALVEDTVFATNKTEWLGIERVYSPSGATASYDMETIINLGNQLLADKLLAGIGVSFGGPTDFTNGRVIKSDHVPGWDDVLLVDILHKAFNTTIRIDNDANAAALGEYRFGAGRGVQDLFYITVSTGVGGGWIFGGRPFRGHNAMAGEIGHTIVDPNGPLCFCGNRGCVERLASGPYMAQDLGVASGKIVAQLAGEGLETAVTILERGAWAVGMAIGNTANLLNPERFVLGGGIIKSGDQWWQVVRETARNTARHDIQFDIVPAHLGDDAPLWGGIALLESNLGLNE